MRVPEALQVIADSEPGEWRGIEIDSEEKTVYRYSFDTEVRIEHHKPLAENREYEAEWTDHFLGDPKLDTSYYIYCGSTPIETVDIAIVDNGHVRIPTRNVHEGYVSQLDLRIAQILTSNRDRLNAALDTADLEISDDTI